jgi:DNA-binding NarL/FixJ family response regulator
MALQEIQRILDPVGFELTSLRVRIQSPSETKGLPVVSVYIIDSSSLATNASELIQLVRSTNPNGQMLVLGEKFSEEDAFPLLNMGVKGLITHEVIEVQLSRALQAVSDGGFWVPRTLLASFVNSVISKARPITNKDFRISRRETEILDGLLLNLTNKEIAKKLNISERTVKFHVSNLLNKFKVQRRADLILLWYQRSDTDAARSRAPGTNQQVH